MSNKWSSYSRNGKIMNEWKDYLSGNKVDGWYGLVKEEYDRLLLESDGPDRLDEMSREVLGEAWDWEGAKYRINQLSNIGSAAWRKISPKARKKYEKEQTKLAKAIGNAAQNLITRDLVGGLDKKYPGFPNMRSKEEFLNALLDIGVVYDSVYAAAQKEPDEEGFLDCISANELIKNLRTIVRFYLDNALGGAGKHFTEEQQKEMDRLREAPNVPVGGVAAPVQGRSRTPRTSKGHQAGYAPPEGPKGKFTQRGKVRDETESTTWKGLQSNVLPALLAAGGAVSIAAGTLFASDWFQAFFQKAGSPPEFGREVKEVLTPYTEPTGVTQFTGVMTNGSEATFGPNATLGQLQSAIQNNVEGGINGLAEMANNGPDKFLAMFEQATAGVSPDTQLQNVFGVTKGPGLHPDLQLSIPKQVVSTIVKSTVKKAAVTGGTTALGTALALSSGVLVPLGIALITSAVAVKLIRMKGMSSSRAQLMKDLLEEMGDVEPCDEKTDPCPPGQHWDEEIKRCVDDPVCPDGTTWNQEQQKCLPDDDDDDEECKEPKIVDDEGNCVCPPGMKEDENGNCIDDDEDDDDEECKEPKVLDDEGNCVCPPGMKEDEDGNCIDDDDTDPDPEPEVVEKIKPILVRFDDDDLKVYAPRVSGKGWDKSFLKTMKKAQKQGLIGQLREASEHVVDSSPEKTLEEIFSYFQNNGVIDDNLFGGVLEEMFGSENTGLLFEVDDGDDGEMSTDSLENDLRGSRGVRWGRAIGAPLGDLYKDLMRKYGKKTKNRRTGVITKNIPKVFFVFDKTLLNKLEPLGINSAQATQLAQKLTAKLSRMKKVQLPPKQIAQVIKSVGLKDKETEILDALNYTNRSGNHIGPVKDTSGKDPLGHLKSPVKEGKRKAPCTSCKKIKKKVLKESRNDDRWDNVKERWKTLSGIK